MTGTAPVRPEPVVVAAKLAGNVAGAVTALAGIFATVGAVTGWPWALSTAAAMGAVAAFLAKYMPLLLAQGARAQVTPLADPQAVDGAPLVPLGKVSGADVSPGMGPDL